MEQIPKFKDLNWGREIGGWMIDGINVKIFPCELGEYTAFHTKGGNGANSRGEYMLRKGKKYIIEPCGKEDFINQLAEKGLQLEWIKPEGESRKLVLKKVHKGIVRRLTDIIIK